MQTMHRMRCMTSCGLVRLSAAAIAVAGCVLAASQPAAQAPAYSPVTDAELRDPPAGDWLMYRRTYDGWGFRYGLLVTY